MTTPENAAGHFGKPPDHDADLNAYLGDAKARKVVLDIDQNKDSMVLG